MGVAIGEPEVLLSRCRSDDWARIRKAGPRPKPRRKLERLADGEEFVCVRQQEIELYRRRWGIAAREFRPGRDTQALLHRRDAIAVFDVDHRAIQASITTGLKMPV